MGLLSCSIPVLFFLVSGCALIDSVIVIEPKKEALATGAGYAMAGSKSADGDCAEASRDTGVSCRELQMAGKAGYEDGTSLKPIAKLPEGKDGSDDGQGSEFANLFRKLVKTGMRLYTWPAAD